MCCLDTRGQWRNEKSNYSFRCKKESVVKDQWNRISLEDRLLRSWGDEFYTKSRTLLFFFFLQSRVSDPNYFGRPILSLFSFLVCLVLYFLRVFRETLYVLSMRVNVLVVVANYTSSYYCVSCSDRFLVFGTLSKFGSCLSFGGWVRVSPIHEGSFSVYPFTRLLTLSWEEPLTESWILFSFI